MKIRHINSLEEDFVEYSEPIYTDHRGCYGYLVIDVHRNIWFIRGDDHLFYNIDNVTDEYIIEY